MQLRLPPRNEKKSPLGIDNEQFSCYSFIEQKFDRCGMKPLSSKQERILYFLRRFLEEKDYPPTIRDIAFGCDISSTSVVDYNLSTQCPVKFPGHDGYNLPAPVC